MLKNAVAPFRSSSPSGQNQDQVCHAHQILGWISPWNLQHQCLQLVPLCLAILVKRVGRRRERQIPSFLASSSSFLKQMLSHLKCDTPPILWHMNFLDLSFISTSYEPLPRIFIHGRTVCSPVVFPTMPPHRKTTLQASQTYHFSISSLIACIVLLAPREMVPTSKFFNGPLSFLL